MPVANFDGETYDRDRDGARLAYQMSAVVSLVKNGSWWTLKDLSRTTGYPESSVSARLRDLRKPKFGSFNVERKYISRGLWAYRVTR